jgi:hypothetical protein
MVLILVRVDRPGTVPLGPVASRTPRPSGIAACQEWASAYDNSMTDAVFAVRYLGPITMPGATETTPGGAPELLAGSA